MRKILLLICILGLSYAASARIDESSWTALNGLQPGQNIQVVDSSSKKHSGIFMRISDTAISLQVASGEEAIQKDDVRTVKLIANKRRARNTLIGGAVGGGIGAGIGAISGAASDKGCSQQTFCIDPLGKGGSAGVASVIGFVGGAVVGGVVGALVPSHTAIYEAKSH